MILLALMLLSLGVADLARPQDQPADRLAVLRAVGAGAAVQALGAWGAGLDWRWVLLGIAVLVGWVLTTPVGALAAKVHPWPIVTLGALALGMLAASAHLPRPEGWLTEWYASLALGSLNGVAFERFALAAGCIVFLVDSANIIVRMVLAGTDPGVMASEQTLKGGRVLGPIERVFIFAMALSGQYAALTAVVAAKGILRFPEISRDVAGRKAEYVLVGSFVSWSLALIFVPLL
ncbi:hypothetical protein [Aeromicrobium sp.]|uniref:hypothetical protein n=1 Tax=Aeromicrobium sp. TaxID=1871063 RepID=UPI0030C21596